MKAGKDLSHLRSYHGRQPNYSYSENCYFNPFYPIGQLPSTPFRYLFPDLAKATFDDHFCSKDKQEIIGQLNCLAEFMVDIIDDLPSTHQESRVPGGYTYFGQFIDHDISAGTDRSHPFQITKKEFAPIHPNLIEKDLVNHRTPFFDLDSVYGGPGLAYQFFGHLYDDDDPVKFKIGENDTKGPGVLPNPELEENPNVPKRDLPRLHLIPKETLEQMKPLKGLPPTTALIGDLRNDENLIVAQFHLSFLKFHNRLIEELRKLDASLSDEELFASSRKELTLIYQWLVLHDFLPNIIGKARSQELLKQENDLFELLGLQEGPLFMPLEFSTAGYRFGHSLVRNQYDFNLNFGRGNDALLPRANFDLLFEFTGKGAIQSERFKKSLPQNWIIQWDRFFNLKEEVFQDRFARKLDTRLADFLTRKGMRNEDISFLSLEERAKVEVTSSDFNSIMKHLAKRNLLKGFLLNIPSAQLLIKAINNLYVNQPIRQLSKSQLQENNSKKMNAFLKGTPYFEATPLWYYILKEAEIQEDGNKLGDLGSWIVGQTIFGLIKKTPNSAIREAWNPQKSSLKEIHSITTIFDFLCFAKVAV